MSTKHYHKKSLSKVGLSYEMNSENLTQATHQIQFSASSGVTFYSRDHLTVINESIVDALSEELNRCIEFFEREIESIYQSYGYTPSPALGRKPGT